MFEWINDYIWNSLFPLFFILVIVFLGILARRYKQYCHKNNLHHGSSVCLVVVVLVVIMEMVMVEVEVMVEENDHLL